MFKKEMIAKLQRIFDLQKVTFDEPGESLEQECLFISLSDARCTVRDKLSKAVVRGELFVVANIDKLPYGYLAKRIESASPSDKDPFYFFDIGKNQQVTNNIAKQSMGFVFFFEEQYDPEVGQITSVTFQEVGEE